jgi:hypothetical protein
VMWRSGPPAPPPRPRPGPLAQSPVSLGAVSWPEAGVSAADITGLGVVAGTGAHRRLPVASVARVMTAYIVLRDHPLSPGQQEPDIVVQAAEAAANPAEVRNGDSLVPVTAGDGSPSARRWRHCCCCPRTTWRPEQTKPSCPTR